MTLSRRSTIKAIGVIGAGSTLTGTALAVSEHEDDEREPEELPEDEDVGALRVGHFSPDAPNVDVLIDGEQVLADVAYDELSPYLEVAPGTYTVTITAAGDPETVVYEQPVAIDAEYYTAAAIGELEADDDAVEDSESDGYTDSESDGYTDSESDEYTDSESDGTGEHASEHDDEMAGESEPTDESGEADDDLDTGTFDVLLLVDDSPEDVAEGTSHVRVVHASPDAPTVDVLNAADDTPLFEDISFGEPSGYLPLEPGSYTVDIAPAADDELENGAETDGTNDEMESNGRDDHAEDELDDDESDAQAEPVASVDLELEENTAYTAYAIGYLEERDAAEEDESVTEDGAADEMDDEADDVDAESDTEDVAETDEDERPFTVRVAVDGTMADEDDELDGEVEDDAGPADDADDMTDDTEPADDADDTTDDTEPADDADDTTDDTEPADDANGYEDDSAEEPVAADD
ncbi:DUF4397 domain-containing protein [Natronorubrum thiooxidans]|uniref:DUF4397 domain-containing protein n=1 Tax=Natronorubrum thiooxidans TaxID=308853 RepID=A0A1N7DCG9_9EURY|nr:DUF4397 domain-containing protein [Natronorubrum thiooxidans]SIR73474.1 protein of unknown function [Natronorubrum thiooxidans]